MLTPRADNFPQWYQELLGHAELADSGPVRGTMVVRPYAYALWEHMQAEVDRRIKATGAENVYFPLLIPESHLQREAEHVEGFSPELAVVTHAGGKDLAEPLVIRPTSETVFGEFMAKWIRSYRDLPLLLNQWANVVRWELRPRVFLRTTEFLWQEGHTAHATESDAARFARTIHDDVYTAFLRDCLAMPVLGGIKTRAERFAGATNTITCEVMMRDRKALQMATSHELGQNFAGAFDVAYTSPEGSRELCWTTSWGSTTRMIGGVIMCHGDDAGLRLPPVVAPVQAIVIAVKDEPRTLEAVAAVEQALKSRGIRSRVDGRADLGLGRRITDWELKGVPVRIEIGPRDLAADAATVVRRDNGQRESVALARLPEAVAELLRDVQATLAREAMEHTRHHLHEVSTVDEACEAARTGFARAPWPRIGEAGERRLNAQAISVRCLQTEDGQVPSGPDAPDLMAIIGRAY